MLKRFFISMLGTVAGVFISGVLAFFVILMLIGVLAGKSISGGNGGLKEHSILHLRLDGAMAERLQAPSLAELLQGDTGAPLALDQLRDALGKAADDKNIDGVSLDCGGFAAGLAGCGELVRHIRPFK